MKKDEIDTGPSEAFEKCVGVPGFYGYIHTKSGK